MKLNKLILLTPMLLSLMACNGSKDSYAGKYSFQLGSDTGTHAGIHLTLTDEDMPNMENPAKKFSLEFDVSGAAGAGIFGSLGNIGQILEAINASTDISIDGIEKAYDAAEQAAESAVAEVTDEPIVIDGYYRIIKEEKQTRLSMGVTLEKFEIDISEDLVEKVMFATIDSEQVNVTIPVSVKDFLFQLYWYGYRVAGLDSLLAPVDLSKEYDDWDPERHQIGLHPTEKEITTIKNHQNRRHDEHQAGTGPTPAYEIGEELYRDYHDYHTLTMGLRKDGKK